MDDLIDLSTNYSAASPMDLDTFSIAVTTQRHWMVDQEPEKHFTVHGVRSEMTIRQLCLHIEQQTQVTFTPYQGGAYHIKAGQAEEAKKKYLDDSDDLTTVAYHNITAGDTIKISYRTVLKGMMDIGQFVQDTLTTQEEICLASNKFAETNENEVEMINNKYQGISGAQFTLIQSLNHLDKAMISELKGYTDQLYNEKLQNDPSDKENLEDFKVYLNKNELIKMIGTQSYDEIIDHFAEQPDEIIIRRCSAVGKHINFHTDVAIKTLQVALNDDSEYDGGRLVFLSNGKVIAPQRPAGSVTIHDCTIVHGVSKLEKGIRYGLFLLKKFI